MSRDELFKRLCSPKTLKTGWHLAHVDSRDDFVRDPVGYADFASNLDERLEFTKEQIVNRRYQARNLLEVDIPKSGLGVRPGNVLPIEDATLLHSIVYLLAPLLDKKLSENVYSYRLREKWEKMAKQKKSIFKDNEQDIPFLKNSTVQELSPFESWYELWTEFENETFKAYMDDGYSHLTKTDIAAYFENVDLGLLESQIRTLLKREEEKIIQVLFKVLRSWTRHTSTGAPIDRGIPQNNQVSSFLCNLYLIPLDRSLDEFCKRRGARWIRYVDDVKVFTRSDKDAREVVFVINEALRSLHLNMQGSKTKILYGPKLNKELDNTELERINEAIKKVDKLNASGNIPSKEVSRELKKLSDVRARFTKGLPESITSIDGSDSKILRRMMTLYGKSRRPQFQKAALVSIKHLPEYRILKKSSNYLTNLKFDRHQDIYNEIFRLLKDDELPFPFQVAEALQTISLLHPSAYSKVSSDLRNLIFGTNLLRKRHWLVVKCALESIFVYPYLPKYCIGIYRHFIKHESPLVRRAACLLLIRSTDSFARHEIDNLVYHPDPGVSSLSLFFMRLGKDETYAKKEIQRIRSGQQSDRAIQYALPVLYALSLSNVSKIASGLGLLLSDIEKTKSGKIVWHKKQLSDRVHLALK